MGDRLDRLAKFVSVAGLLVVVFLAGMVWTGLELWPYPLLKAASQGANALRLRYLRPNWAVFPHGDARSGVTVHVPGAPSPGLTLLSLQGRDGFGARLVDLDGRVVHEWSAAFEKVWADGAPHIRRPGNPEYVRWHGVHLFPNGDLLLNFETEHFPYGGGLVRLDKDSNVLWKLARNTHHDVEVADDGTILVAALNQRDEPLPEVPFLEAPFYEDVVLKVSPDDGRVLDEISLPLALRDAAGLFVRSGSARAGVGVAGGDGEEGGGRDPTHLNDVELVTPALARDFPMLAPGDLVVSLRTPNAIVAIDGATRRAKLILVGSWVRQHDPDLLPGGLISFYDNRGGPPECGGTRIVKLDPATQRIVWQYDGCRGGDRFDSYAWGDHQWLPNGNLLVADPFAGRAFEVATGDAAGGEAAPRVVWEYVNGLGARDGRNHRGVVGEVRRFAEGDLPFVSGRGPGPEAGPSAAAAPGPPAG